MSVNIPLPTPLPHPEPARENIEMTETTVEQLLAQLKDEVVREKIRNGLDSVITYCQKNKFNFSDWRNFDPAKHSEQVTRVYTLLGISDNFKDIAAHREELNTLISLMEMRNEILQESRAKSETLSDDVASGAIKKVGEHVKGLFRDHPLATIFASGMALWGASALWNTSFNFKFGGKDHPVSLFKWAVIGTAGAYAVNHLLGPVFGGRDAIDSVLGMPDSKFEELLAGAEDRDNGIKEVDKRAFRAMVHMGMVPFSVFLNAYQRAVTAGNLEINMRSLERAARRTRAGRQVPRHYFDPKNGRGLFAELERLVGGKTEDAPEGRIAFMQQKYIENGLNMSLFKVMAAEYDAVADDDEALLAATGEKKDALKDKSKDESKDATPSVAPETPELKIDQTLTDELKGANSDLAALHPEVLEGGTKARIMGFTMDIVRTKDDAKGDFFYEIDADPGQTPAVVSIALDLSDKGKPPTLPNEIASLKTVLQARANRLVKAIEPSMAAPQWNPVAGKWELLPISMPWDPRHFTTLGLTSPSSLPLRLNFDDNNAAQLFYGDHQIVSLDDLRETIKEDGVETALRSQPDTAQLFRGLDVEVTDAKVWPRILINVEGAIFTALRLNHPAPGKFLIYNYEPSAQFFEAKGKAIQKRPDFKNTFENLALSGEKFSNFTRTAFDYLQANFRNADSKNHYWLQLVELKKFELVHDYQQALRAVKDGDANAVEALNKAEEELARSLGSFKDYPNNLTNARDNADKYKALEHEFANLGYGSKAYQNRTEAFYTTVNALNFEGWSEKSSSVHQEMVFNLMRLWYERTRELKDVTDFSANQTEFLNQLQSSFTGILGRGILNDTGFLQKVRAGLSYDEFKLARPEFDVLPTYLGWQIDTGKTEALIANLPLLGQVGQSFTIIPGAPPAAGSAIQNATIRFNNGQEWKITFDSSKPAGEQIDLKELNMTPDMVRAQVTSVENSSSFKTPFDRLKNIWANMDDRNWDHPFEGQVEEGKWNSLVEYKRQEALLDYQRDLEEVLRLPTDKRANSWKAIHDKFGERYLGGLDLLGTSMANAIDAKLAKTPPEKLTRDDFDTFYGHLEGAGYKSNGYMLKIQALRRDAKFFDYVGWRGLDSRKEHDILNKVVALQHRYMRVKNSDGFAKHFRRLDTTEWNQNHEKYFDYVRGVIMNYLRSAFNNNANGAGTWLDSAIGAEELPQKLSVVPFEKFLTRQDLLTAPNFSYSPANVQAPAETAAQLAARKQGFHNQLEAILKEKFIDPITVQTEAQKAADEGGFWNFELGDVDPDDFSSAETSLRHVMETFVNEVGENSDLENQKLKAFRDLVKTTTDSLQGWDSWAPWS